MKHFLKSIFFLILIVQASSCLDFGSTKKEKLSDEEFKTVTINDDYSIKVPKYMKEAKNLNDEASLQYQNIYKETYIVVIDESKSEFKNAFIDIGEYNDSISLLKNYKQVQLQFFKESLTNFDFISENSKKINDINAELVDFNGKINGVIYDIGYSFTFLEGEERVYMLMAWTLKNRKEKYQETFEYMSNSFTILN